MSNPAVLVLEDGSVFKGISIGASGRSKGEVVFNTSLTGYQEILTDPSYAQQMVTLTYPHIGNTGVNSEDEESSKVWVNGLIIRDLPLLASNWRSEETLSAYLVRHEVVAIADIDTRRLTRLLREKGALSGAIIARPDAYSVVDEGLGLAQEFPGLKGMDLAKQVSVSESYAWTEAVWQSPDKPAKEVVEPRFHVVAYDFGVKRNILRMLVERGCKVTVVPAQTSAEDVLALQPDGVFLSNGPGDPEPCGYAIKAIQTLLEANKPLFGICLGYQLLALALGAKTLKMKFGHHGANHPVQDIQSGKVLITSQNHGFAVDEESLPDLVEATHRSLFDNSLQGIQHRQKAAFGFQG
ncbi:MAG: glutamine-hydrolyzing carbamoyl-phosphate synthase small subunit, partial [Gammaproteobacteria bacterium]|nr:glutamine-hydrolyzing carbamoyl-phosphate synthase small subunit [Gammaproteobacteria bacterium]